MISVIIPTLNAQKTLPTLLEHLGRQTLAPDEIVIVDSESTDQTTAIAKASGARVLTVKRSEFDHGGTRDWALGQTQGDIICFLTQDALPMDENYLCELTKPLSDPGTACACGRQVARADARPEEALTRQFNYPDFSFVRTSEDVRALGIKAYFLSDACSAYRRDAYTKLGGFEHPILTNEDMLIAARFLRAGYAIAYQAGARVEHSHAFTLKQDYQRSCLIGAFLSRYGQELGGASADAEGLKYVSFVSKGLLKRGRIIAFCRFGLHCAARWLGSRTKENTGGKTV